MKKNKSLLCVGLDPDPDLMPISDVFEFNRRIIDATEDLVCAYKPNLPFYEALGVDGLRALEKTVAHIREVAPHALVLGDGKRGDIASTNVKYARALFDVWGFDAVTVNGYAGGESLQPFFDYADRGVFVWCRSSNRGSKELQDLRLSDGNETATLYEWVAKCAVEWNSLGNVGLVVGATYPEELARVRAVAPGMLILIPGVGAQSGELDAAVKSGLDGEVPNILVSSSRGITYASRDERDFAQAARGAAENLR
ncbi:MAG: orotidine-5'-phosphate decarboxylase, partial [Chloroflexi bacterium]|nr:orotidine-5'-phosphate decarboxylase [Chloroflexota bacterium]